MDCSLARTELAAIVADQRERVEAMRAVVLERGLPTAALDELLFAVIALQREIEAGAVSFVPLDSGAGNAGVTRVAHCIRVH